MEESLSKRLEKFAADRSSGSAELAREALNLIVDYCSTAVGEDIRREIPLITEALMNAQPSMAAVLNIADRVERMVSELSERKQTERIITSLKALKSDLENEYLKTIEAAAAILSRYSAIATYSRSSLVEKALLKLAGKAHPLGIILSESRPGLEGVKLAKNLAGAGLKVNLCVDAALPQSLKKAEAFLIGADAVAENRFCNKIGTRNLCETSFNAGIPVFVMVTKDKFLPPRLEKHFKIRNLETDVIYDHEFDNITVFNQLFEWCDSKFVDKFLTSRGELSPRDLPQQFQEVELCLKSTL